MQLKTESAVPQEQPQVNQQSTASSPAKQGLLFVLSGPSGSGKDTVIAALKQRDLDFHVVVSTNVHGNWYGQPRQEIRDNLAAGRDVLLKVDVQGAATVRRKVPGAILIFLAPDSPEELAQRLVGRHTETEVERQRRLADAQLELAQQHWYDYRIVNRQGHLQEAVDLLRAIMLAEHCRVQPRHIEI